MALHPISMVLATTNVEEMGFPAVLLDADNFCTGKLCDMSVYGPAELGRNQNLSRVP